MPNATARKFGYPDTLVAEHGPWLVLLRPKQPTLGSITVVYRGPATAFGQLDAAAFAALQPVVAGVERLLKSFVDYQRINHVMLMMVDPDVHFHVIPRYEAARDFDGQSFADKGWPGPPALDAVVALTPEQIATLTARLRAEWAA